MYCLYKLSTNCLQSKLLKKNYEELTIYQCIPYKGHVKDMSVDNCSKRCPLEYYSSSILTGQWSEPYILGCIEAFLSRESRFWLMKK